MTRKIKSCRVCGAAFEASPNDTTVNCPDHRKRSSAASADTQVELRIAQAKGRGWGYAARAAGDTAEYEKAIAELNYWKARR